MTKLRDYYKILQVDPEAEPEVITAAYRRLAAKYHPDVNKAADAAARMRDINEAYSVIGNPVKRSEYDRQRAAQQRARATTARSTYYATRKTAPLVTITPSHLAFGSVPKGTTKTLSVQISVTEGRTLIGDLRASQPWIRLSTNRLFNTTTLVNVQVDTSTLEAGTLHTGTIIVDSIAYGTRSIPVSVRVEVAARPILVATPSILDFGHAVNGRAPKVLSIRLSNGGAGVLAGTIISHQPWLSVSQTSWVGNQAVVQAIADASGLIPDHVYEGQLELSSNGGRCTIPARLRVMTAESMPLQETEPQTAHDLDFLRKRMLILQEIKSPTAAQESEQMVIAHLLQICKGGDVAIVLQRAIEGAQGWRGQAYLAEGIPLSANLLPVLVDLFQRLQRWETHEG